MKKATAKHSIMEIGGIGPVEFVRSARKSVALVVETDGRVIVRAPFKVPQAYLAAWVAEKAGWVGEKRAEMVRRAQAPGRAAGSPRRFAVGEQFLYLGQAYPLEIRTGQRPDLLFAGRFSLSATAGDRACQVFENWYRGEARAYFRRRVDELARQHGFTVNGLRLSSARTRWGSCGPTGTLNLNWRLIMAPPDVIDYVILHELAHLRERNHSARFWSLVAALAPGYQTQRKWLKTNGGSLNWP
jgi:predicted metal-dependent hydrolase